MSVRLRYWLLVFMVLCLAFGVGWLAVVTPLAWLLAEEAT